jgi:hypothetical protein
MEQTEKNDSNETDIAMKKLEKLMSNDCTSFALRVMNEGEYRNIIEKGKPLQGGEANVITKKSFKQWLSNGIKLGIGNSYSLYDLTGWDRGSVGINRADDDLNELRRIQKNTTQSRGEVMQLFAKYVSTPQRTSGMAFDITQSELSGPDAFSREELRKILNDRSRKLTTEPNESKGHYHILTVLDPTCVTNHGTYHDEWRTIKPRVEPEHLWGAFSLLPYKDLAKDMIEQSSHAGLLAHPVFSETGKVLWPKENI